MTQHGQMANGWKFTTAATQPLTCSDGTLPTKPPKLCTSTRRQSLIMMPTTHHRGKSNQMSTWSSPEMHSPVRCSMSQTPTTSSRFTTTQGQASTKQHGPSQAAHHPASASKKMLRVQPMIGSQPTPQLLAASTQAVARVDQPFIHPIWSSTK